MTKGTVEAEVARHYGAGGLLERIRAALEASGIDPKHLRAEDLNPVDEFHIGGPAATADLVAQLDLGPGMEVLDIGSGLGGTARHVARASGAQVTGLDVTEEFVSTAQALSEMTGLGEATRFDVGSALAMPFPDARFDAALMVHVGMNIPDKERLFAEARRVLKPGAMFGVYEVMRTGEGELPFPLPWAEEPGTSFLGTPEDYRVAAQAAGFAIVAERSRRAMAVEFFARMKAALEAEGGPPPLGVHLLMQDRERKVANMAKNIQAGLIAPVEMILRAPA